MELKEYKNYCKVTDSIIKDSQNYFVNSITSLNPVRPSIRLLNEIKKEKNINTFKFLFKFFINNFKFFFKIFISNIFNLKNIFTINRSTKFHTIIISHILDKKNFAKKKDFYFGEIIKSCKKQSGIFLVQINWSKNKSYEILNFISNNKSENNRLIIGKSMDFKYEIKLYFNLLKTFFYLINKSKKNTKLKKNYLFHSKNIFSSSSVQANRIAISIENIIKQVNPKRVMITLEGHSWERLSFYVAKKFNSEIQCIGYLHAGIFKHQHSLMRLFKYHYNPDLILTCGKSSYMDLKENFKNSKISVENIGCSRKINNDKLLLTQKKFIQEDTCLILPEGDINDLDKFVNFSLLCLKLKPNLKFIIKIHPNMNLLNIKRIYEKHITKNIEFTKSSIAKNSRKASFALYCSSTSIVEAISFGLLPIYLNDKSKISFDFIHNLKNFRRTINNTEDYLNIIREYKKTNLKKLLIQNFDYANFLYSPLNKGKIKNIFNLH